MTKLMKEKIIIPAWELIKDDYKIKQFYIFPGLLSIIFLTVLLVYQSIYTYVILFGKKHEALLVILNFFQNDYIIEILISAVIFLITYIIITPIFEGGLIKYIHQKNNNDEISSGEAIGQGIYKFLPIFEYNNIFSEFKIMSILNAFLFTIRFLGAEYMSTVTYIFLIILLLGIIINILFIYSKFIIVLDNKNVFNSVGLSSKITILNLGRTIRLYFLMFILNLRVIFNFVIFLIFPIIIVIAIGLITTKIFLVVAITILSVLFLAFILALGYLTAVLEVFTKSIWYYAYIEGKKKLDKKDMKDD